MYSPTLDSMVMMWPNFLHNFLAMYNPIPVDLAFFLPFKPVNDLSKTLDRLSFGIPIPLSKIHRYILLSFSKAVIFI